MRALVSGLLAVLAAAVAAMFWMAVAQLSFVLTGSDPLDLAFGDAFTRGAGFATVAILAAGSVAFALVSRAVFRFRNLRPDHG